MRPRGYIVKVGYIENNKPYKFVIDCKNNPMIPAVMLTTEGILYAGYSVDELRLICEAQAVLDNAGKEPIIND